MRFYDLTGRKVGKLTVLRRHTTGTNPRWWCRCECGREISVLGARIRGVYRPERDDWDIATSCGCDRPPKITGTVTYRRWISIRGKAVERWDDYYTFAADIDVPHPKDHILSRPDKSKPWGPGNFKWMTVHDSRIGRGRKHLACGQMLTIQEIIKITGLSKWGTHLRIRNGFDPITGRRGSWNAQERSK